MKPRELTVLEGEAPAPPPDPAGLLAPPGEAVAPPKAARKPRPAKGPKAEVAPAPAAAEVRDPNEVDLLALVGQEIQAWTDGAASGNPGPAGAGVVLLFKEHRKEGSIYLGETTNNVAELTAVREALLWIKQRDFRVRVCTDSTYVIGVLTGSMKAKANIELIASIRSDMRGFKDLAFVKVDAHAGVFWNERADALAREATRTKRSRTANLSGPPV